MHQYAVKEQTYFTNVRRDLIRLLPPGEGLRVLEIGAGGGDTLVAMKQTGRVAEAVGVELFELPGSHQDHPLIDHLFLLDIEKESLPLPENHFDAVVCGDVLEHLVDPWAVVEKLVRFLKPGGWFILSVPNFREITTVYRVVVRGDFAYNPLGGVLDRTHLRFFCRKNAIALATTGPLRLRSVHSNLTLQDYRPKRYYFDRLTLGLFRGWLTSQHLVVSEKIAS